MITHNTNTNNNDISFSFNLSVTENNKNINYSIHIKQTENNIQIDAYEIDEIKKYSQKLSLQDLKNLDKNFRIYDSLSEVYTFLDKSKNKNGISISKKDNKLILIISLFNIDDTKVNISLTQNELTESELINQHISSLKNRVTNLEKKILELSEKHEKDIENLKQLINIKNEKENENENEYQINKYIQNYSDLIFIEKEIIKQLGKKVKSYNLIYKASRDGSKSSDFHNKCDNANYNLSIVKTKKGRLFGGFTTQNWKENTKEDDKHKYDANSFVFSINNKKIYNISDKKRAIYCRNDLALFFSGTSDIYIYDNCFNCKGGTAQSAYDYKGEKYALNGEESFELEDYEVFKVEFV